MKAIAGITLGLVLSALTAPGALALGLGNAVGQAILGAPLRIEIALIGSEAGVPAIDCFNLRPPQAAISSTYVLRNAQLQLLGEPGRASLVVISSSPVQEPVLEFALAVGCGFGLSKDYLLLTEEPTRTAAQVLPTLQPAASVTQPAKALPAPATAPAGPPSGSLLRVPAALSLAALARQTYPLQPKAREKFQRMMQSANPGLESGESLIAADTELRVPPGLPVRRQGSRPPGSPRSQAATADSADSVNAVSPRAPAADKPAGDVARSRQDLLVVGAAAGRKQNPAELLAEAERLARTLLEQTQAQDALAEKIGKLDDTLAEIKKHYVEQTNRLNQIEAERRAERLAPKPASLDFIELLLAVLAGGLIGALSLYLFNRRQLQRGIDPVPSSRSASAGMPVATPDESARPAAAAQEDFDFCLTAPSFPSGREEAGTQAITKAVS
ncbi:MAG: hypothetical protein WCV99_18645 [Sterolibacterium sp.]|jgi:hypothetical protein